MTKAKISEIFESVQGEGLYLGQKQVFVRFYGCSVGCVFCDTPQAGYKEFSGGELKSTLSSFFKDYHSLCLTGGEPLEQVDFLEGFLKDFKETGVKVYLETNGTRPSALRRVIDDVDIIAMDFKLPSSTLKKDFWQEHEDFLGIARAKDVFVKIVVAKGTQSRDIARTIEIIKKGKPDIAVVLQPNWLEVDAGLLAKMESIKDEFRRAGIADVKILPQAHKYAGIR